MSYTLTQFRNALLPDHMTEDDLSTGDAQSSLLDSVGSAYDYWYPSAHGPRKRTITHRGMVVGETAYLVDEAGNPIVDEAGNYLVAGLAAGMLRAQVDALKAERHQVGPLWRERLDDGARQWITARLLGVQHKQTVVDIHAHVATLESRFETLDIAWRAANATTVTAGAAAATPTGLLVQNGGDVAVADAVLSVARTSGTITAVRVQGPGIDWTWTGSIGAGQTLTLDCGAQIMRVGSANAYSGWVRGVGHTADGMLPLGVGDTILTVTLTGGGGDVTLTHYNQFG